MQKNRVAEIVLNNKRIYRHFLKEYILKGHQIQQDHRPLVFLDSKPGILKLIQGIKDEDQRAQKKIFMKFNLKNVRLLKKLLATLGLDLKITTFYTQYMNM